MVYNCGAQSKNVNQSPQFQFDLFFVNKLDVNWSKILNFGFSTAIHAIENYVIIRKYLFQEKSA